MVERRAWACEADPGGGGIPWKPGEPHHMEQYLGEDFIWVIVEDVEDKNVFKNIHPRLAYMALTDRFPQQQEIKRMRDRGFLMRIKRDQQEAVCGDGIVLKIQNDQVPVKIAIHKNLSQVKGTIYHEDLPLHTKEELMEDLKKEGVVDVIKLKYKDRDNVVREQKKVILIFDRSSLPTHVRCTYMRLRVEPYIPKPLQCRKCYEFGHVRKYCKSASNMCGFCKEEDHVRRDGEGVAIERCQNSMFCLNCKSTEHVSSSFKCEVFIKNQAITEIATTRKVSFGYAKMLYEQERKARREQNVVRQRPQDPTTQTMTTSQTEDITKLNEKVTEMTATLKVMCSLLITVIQRTGIKVDIPEQLVLERTDKRAAEAQAGPQGARKKGNSIDEWECQDSILMDAEEEGVMRMSTEAAVGTGGYWSNQDSSIRVPAPFKPG